MVRGIFGLDRVYKKQVQNIKDDNFESWPESATYGYFGGGTAPSIVATIDRIDFSNETTSAPTNNLPQGREFLAAVSGGADRSEPPVARHARHGAARRRPTEMCRLRTMPHRVPGQLHSPRRW